MYGPGRYGDERSKGSVRDRWHFFCTLELAGGQFAGACKQSTVLFAGT